MRIIAIDPGPKQSAVLFWTNEHVALPRIMPNEELRSWILETELLRNPKVVVAIEMIACYGMAVGAETFETCLFIGRLQEICEPIGIRVMLVYRREVKILLCGSMKAKDANIRQALIDKYGIVGTKKNPGKLFGISSHLWSALGVAVAAQNKLEMEK